MPGKKSINWNDTNDARLLAAVVYELKFVPPKETAQAIADVMGGGVTSTAIQHRVRSLRQHYEKTLGRQALGTPVHVTTHRPSSGVVRAHIPPSSTPTKRPASTTKTNTPAKKRRVQAAKESDEESEADEAEETDEELPLPGQKASNTPRTPQTPSGPARRSQRNTPCKNYAALEDPYAEDILDDVLDFKAESGGDIEESGDESEFQDARDQIAPAEDMF